MCHHYAGGHPELMEKVEYPEHDHLQALLQEKWPSTTFQVPQDKREVCVQWKDGPAYSSVHDLARTQDLTLPLYVERTISRVVWALALQDELDATPTALWSSQEIWGHYHASQGSGTVCDSETVYDRLGELDEVDLFDLSPYAENARDLTQAEIADGIFPLARGHHGVYNIWLRHGGWALAGTLLDS